MGAEAVGKGRKVALILAGLVLMVVIFVGPAMFAMKSLSISYVYMKYADEVSNLTGLNRYIITAAALLLFIPFWSAANMMFAGLSLSEMFSVWKWGEFGARRRKGLVILITLGVVYNLSLYYVTKDMAFSFSEGTPKKWYALTPEGVRFYDRPGVDPGYGIPLRPVTPEVIRNLKLLQQGEFRPIDLTRATPFNPITGQAQVWYHRYEEGALEFYDKPGHHPLTGVALKPITQEIVAEWRKGQSSKSQPAPGPRTEGGSTGPEVMSKARTTVLEIRSEPRGAEAYIDWKAKGATPLTLEMNDVSGLLVVAKEGHQAVFRRLGARENGEVDVNLPPESKRSRSRLLLVVSDGAATEESFAALKGRLVEEGFTVMGIEEAREFQRELSRAGGLSHKGFRAWARAKFDTDLVVTARFQHRSRELGDQEFGHAGVRDAVKGAVKAEVKIDLEVSDLRSGDQVTAASVNGSGFALDRGQGLNKALSQAVVESSKLLRERLRG